MTITIRTFRPGDKEAILAVSAAADKVDRAERRMTAEELDEWLHVPGVQPERDFFIAEADGQAAGYAGVDVMPGELERHIAYCGGEVEPAQRRKGIGAALMRAVEARAAEIMAGMPSGLDRHLESYCRSTQADVQALFSGLGMTPIRRFLSMQRDLRGALPPPETPLGFTIRAYRDEDDEPLHAALNDAFQDHWGHEPMSRADWQHFLRGAPHFRPDLWLLAWAGGDLAGFSLSFVDPGYIAQVGRAEGKIAEVGVRRAWRRRGVAAALLQHTFRALRAAGMAWGGLIVDAESLTDAVRLYERCGFTTKWQNVVFRKSL